MSFLNFTASVCTATLFCVQLFLFKLVCTRTWKLKCTCTHSYRTPSKIVFGISTSETPRENQHKGSFSTTWAPSCFLTQIKNIFLACRLNYGTTQRRQTEGLFKAQFSLLLKEGTEVGICQFHIVWKLLKMSHLNLFNFGIFHQFLSC